MAVEWYMNGQLVADLGLTMVRGAFRTAAPSFILLDTAADVEAAPVFAYDQQVTVVRKEDGVAKNFFVGRMSPVTRSARPEYEGHAYVVEDAWAQLERTIYQEKWWTKVGANLVEKWSPRIVFAIKGQAIGQAIRKIVNYAAEAGVSIQMGTCPDGEQLFCSESTNISCAEALITCLKHHPDWIPWIDHSTSPPTLNVTDVDAATERNHVFRTAESPDDFEDTISDFEITKRDDLLPEGVVLVFELAMTYEDEVYRQIALDKYPGDCPERGPNILTAFLPLEGMQMQMQKSRVMTRRIPSGPANPSGSVVKKFLKRKYLHLRDVPEDRFAVTEFTRELLLEDLDASEKIDEDEDADFPADPPSISRQAKRIKAQTVDDLPRELVSGQIEDWMRRKVGNLLIKAKISPTGAATAEEKKKIAIGCRPKSVVATNATTKLYKGISQWVPAEDVPVGIAQATYEAIHKSMPHDGFVELTMEDVPDTRHHGTVVNILGLDPTWAEMRAPVHSVDWEMESGKVRIGFGPVPELAPADFLEMQRMIRHRPVKWWSVEERGSAEFGAAGSASAAGDTVAGFHGPETDSEDPEMDLLPCPFGRLEMVDGETVILGGPVKAGPANISVPNRPINLTQHGSWNVYVRVSGLTFNTSDDEKFVLPGIKAYGGTTAWDKVESDQDYPDDTLPDTPTGSGEVILPIGVLTVSDGGATLQATGCGPFEVGQCGGVFTISPRS